MILLCFTNQYGKGAALLLAGLGNMYGSFEVQAPGMLKWITENIGFLEMFKWGVSYYLNQIGSFFSNFWHNIETTAEAAWSVVSRWWNENIASPVASAWGKIEGFFAKMFHSISLAGQLAWGILQQWWGDITGKFKKAWDDVSGFFGTLFGSSEIPGSIACYANNAYNEVSTWWDANVLQNFQSEGVWGGVKGFFQGIFVGADGEGGILGYSKQALNGVLDWTKEKTGLDIKSAWGEVKDFFRTLFGSSELVGSIAYYANNAWNDIRTWWDNGIGGFFDNAWGTISEKFSTIFTTIRFFANLAYTNVKKWWDDNIWSKVSGAWDKVSSIFGSVFSAVQSYFTPMWQEVQQLWGNITGAVESAWTGVKDWFKKNVTDPIVGFFTDCINGIIDGINGFIKILNSINITVPAFSLPIVGELWGETTIGIHGIAEIQHIGAKADGGFVGNGDLFIANERGAELIGSIGGHTAVANNEQIIAGIQRGVSDANQEQNALLRQQNELLRRILEKDNSVRPSALFGRTVRESLDMFATTVGG